MGFPGRPQANLTEVDRGSDAKKTSRLWKGLGVIPIITPDFGPGCYFLDVGHACQVAASTLFCCTSGGSTEYQTAGLDVLESKTLALGVDGLN